MQGVRQVKNSDNFKAYLRFLSRFHQYSFHNTMLILNQCPHASYVAGYKTWRDQFHRQVIKGSKAIKILAPCPIKRRVKDDQDEEMIFFKTVNVFDISQTVGEEIPEAIKELNGESHEALKLIPVLEKAIALPIAYVKRENDPILFGGAHGYYNTALKTIVIADNLKGDQLAKTLCHEWMHALFHQNTAKSTRAKEIEAEALTFVILQHFHLDSGDYSFPYIASYAKDDEELLLKILKDIQSRAHELIAYLEPRYQAKSVLTKRTAPKIFTGNVATSSLVK